MKIDRTTFLLITTAITATAMGTFTGCSLATTTNTNNTSGADAGVDSAIDPEPDAAVRADADTDAAADAGKESGPTCLDDDGVAPTCKGAGASAGCDFFCAEQATTLKHGIARDVAECLYKLPGYCAAETAGIPECIASAKAKACDDASVQAYCQPLLCPAGGGMPKADCESVAKALSAAARAELAECVTSGGPCDEGGAFCLEQFR